MPTQDRWEVEKHGKARQLKQAVGQGGRATADSATAGGAGEYLSELGGEKAAG